jgi:hypothetical protein
MIEAGQKLLEPARATDFRERPNAEKPEAPQPGGQGRETALAEMAVLFCPVSAVSAGVPPSAAT